MATVDDFINKMKTQLGKPYVWGGESPNVGFDCSGLIYWALKSLGITGWTHQSEALINQAKPISVAQGKTTKGALLYYPGHIVVSLGNGQIIEAPQPGTPVRITGDYGGWTRAGTIPQLTNTPTRKETKVESYNRVDAKAAAGKRVVSPTKHFYLHTNPNAGDSQASNIVGPIGYYDITVQLAVKGTPGDVIAVRYLLQDAASGKDLAWGPWDDTTIPPRGYIASTSTFKRYVPRGAALYIQVKSSEVAKGNVTVTRLASDAYVFMEA